MCATLRSTCPPRRGCARASALDDTAEACRSTEHIPAKALLLASQPVVHSDASERTLFAIHWLVPDRDKADVPLLPKCGTPTAIAPRCKRPGSCGLPRRPWRRIPSAPRSDSVTAPRCPPCQEYGSPRNAWNHAGGCVRASSQRGASAGRGDASSGTYCSVAVAAAVTGLVGTSVGPQIRGASGRCMAVHHVASDISDILDHPASGAGEVLWQRCRTCAERSRWHAAAVYT